MYIIVFIQGAAKPMTVRGKIIEYLQKYGLSLCELSALSDISESRLQKIFYRKKNMTVREYALICKSLSVDISFFLQ